MEFRKFTRRFSHRPVGYTPTLDILNERNIALFHLVTQRLRWADFQPEKFDDSWVGVVAIVSLPDSCSALATCKPS